MKSIQSDTRKKIKTDATSQNKNKMNQDDASAWNNKGVALNNLGQYEEAIEAYDKAIGINPDNADAWINKGNMLDKLGQYEKAIKAYDKAIAINPDYAGAWYNKGNALIWLGRYWEAIKAFDKVIAIKPDNADPWNNKGVALDKLGQYEEAIEAYNKAIAINPDNADAWNNKGNMLDKLGQYEKAIKAYDKAIAINPDYAGAWNNKGNALNNLGRYGEAIKAYDKVIAIKPDYSDAWYNKGVALRNLGQYEEAIETYDEAIGIKPDYASVWENKEITDIRYIVPPTKNKFDFDKKGVSITRENEFYNGFIRFKMSVTNNTDFVVHDVTLDFDFDDVLLQINRHEPDYPTKNGKILLGIISGNSSKSIAIYLDPMMCSKGTDINCHINYKDAKGQSQSTIMKPKQISVVCPIMETESDINIGRLKEFIEKLPYRDSKVYQIQNGFDIDVLKNISREIVQKHDVKHIRTLFTKDGNTCEIWYYGETKVHGHDIVIKITILSETKSIELFAATETVESLAGLLAEVGRELKSAIESKVTGNVQQVINVSIKDSIIQRSNLLSYCDIDGNCSGDVVIEDSLVTRSEIGFDVNGNYCSACGEVMPEGAKFCNECGERLQ